MGSSAGRTLLSIVMNVLIVIAIILTVRLGVAFFGQLAAQSWGKAVLAFSKPLVMPFGLHAIKTPYGGVFEVNTAVSIAAFLLIEWVVSFVRDRD